MVRLSGPYREKPLAVRLSGPYREKPDRSSANQITGFSGKPDREKRKDSPSDNSSRCVIVADHAGHLSKRAYAITIV